MSSPAVPVRYARWTSPRLSLVGVRDAQSRRAVRRGLDAVLLPSDAGRRPRFGGAARRDWVAGRLALREAVTRFVPGQPLDDIAIAYLPSGQPVLVGLDDAYCSISHSNGWGIAAVSTLPIGVDIERIRPRPPSLRRLLLDDSEWQLLSSVDVDRRLTVAWSVKEATLKLLGSGLSIHPRGLRLTRRTRSGYVIEVVTGRAQAARVHVGSLVIGDFAIALACTAPQSASIGWYREPRI